MGLDDDEFGEDQELLILYLSGELPEDQRAAMERRLSSDAPLKAELERLRAAQAMIWSEMLAADSVEPLRGVTSTAHRKLAGMVRQWAVDRLVREPAVLRSQTWVRLRIAVAAAAVIALGTIIYTKFPENSVSDAIVDASSVPGPDVVDEVDAPDEQFVNLALSDVEQELDALVELRTLTTIWGTQ